MKSNTEGDLGVCDESGKCKCKYDNLDDKCEQCMEGYYGPVDECKSIFSTFILFWQIKQE